LHSFHGFVFVWVSEGDRLIDFLKCIVVMFFVFIFVETGLLIVLIAIQFRAEAGTILTRRFGRSLLTSADSGSSWIWGIALTGVSANVQPRVAYSAVPKIS
jgi:hypothetical protein